MAAPAEAPPATEPGVVELIVHGVSGVPPEAVLRAPIEEITRVRGDKSAGFYRRRPDEGPQGKPRTPEAFSWGGLTSGPASRALWFLFLPFILINLANWMLPPAKDKKVAAVSISILRLLGLSLTLTILLAAVSVFVDMVGWQCAGMAQCSARLGPASFLASLPTRGAQLAVTAVPVALLIGALWFFGRSPAPYGEPPDPALTSSEAAPLTQTTFWNRDKSVDRLRSCHLAAAFSGLAILVTFAPLVHANDDQRQPWPWLLGAQVVVFGIAGVATSWNRVTARGGRGVCERLNKCMNRALWPTALGLLIITLVMVGLMRVDYPNVDVKMDPGSDGKDLVKPTLLPGLYEVIASLVAVQVVLIVLLFVLTALSRLHKKDARNLADRNGFEPTLGGFTAPFVALMAWLIGGGLSLGLGLWVARFLGDPVESSRLAQCEIGKRESTLQMDDKQAQGLLSACGEPRPDISRGFEDQVHALGEHAPLILPTQYYAAAIANLVLIIVVVITAASLFLYVLWRAGKRRTAINTEYGVGESPSQQQKDRVKEIARTQEWAHVPDWAPNLLAGLLIFAVADVACWVIVLRDVAVSSSSTINTAADWSQAVTAFLAAAFVGLVLAAFRDRNTRRAIAVLWDVITFWPQAAHPLGPPCYGEIAVPKLRDRVSELTTGQSGQDSSEKMVVLVAHSQGTIISSAMLMQTMVPSLPVAGGQTLAMDMESRLPAEERQQMSSRVAFLTFGCPLRKLYARNFPAYFGYEVLDSLAPKQDKLWLNLWAPTDPIGAWVFKEGPTVEPTEPPENAMATLSRDVVDVRLHDVVELVPLAGADAPPICGHSGFWTRQEYLDSVEVLGQRLDPESPPSAPQEKYSLPSEAP
jgi:hypothetical protein